MNPLLPSRAPEPGAPGDRMPSAGGPSRPGDGAGRVRTVLALALAGAGAAALVALGLHALAGEAGGARSALAAALATLLVGLPMALWLSKFTRRIARLRQRLAQMADAAAAQAAQTVPASRAQFQGVVEREWARARRHGHGAAVLLMQPDAAGEAAVAADAVLAAALLEDMERCARQTLRGGDAVVRWSEGRLAVFLAPADALGALDAAERLRERLGRVRLEAPGRVVQTSVSAGVALLRPGPPDAASLLQEAARALRAARDAGGACIRTAPPPDAAPGPLEQPPTRGNRATGPF